MKEEKTMLDINPDTGVQISIREDGRQVWINVDGLCRMRLTATPGKSFELSVEDRRSQKSD